ncbi:hypothetical protein QOT17_014845 [Balamuthia mandrillaris]
MSTAAAVQSTSTEEEAQCVQLIFKASAVPFICGPYVVLERQTIVQIVQDTVGPALKKRVTRKPRDLPLRFSVELSSALHQLFFGEFETTLSSLQQIEEIFGENSCITYERGSYAKLQPPLHIKRLKNKTKFTIFYAVYNRSHVLQWPEAAELSQHTAASLDVNKYSVMPSNVLSKSWCFLVSGVATLVCIVGELFHRSVLVQIKSNVVNKNVHSSSVIMTCGWAARLVAREYANSLNGQILLSLPVAPSISRSLQQGVNR